MTKNSELVGTFSVPLATIGLDALYNIAPWSILLLLIKVARLHYCSHMLLSRIMSCRLLGLNTYRDSLDHVPTSHSGSRLLDQTYHAPICKAQLHVRPPWADAIPQVSTHRRPKIVYTIIQVG